MEIRGRYEKDSNFTTVYTDNCMCTIARNTGERSCLEVGELAAVGGRLTQERYDELAGQCQNEGTFWLE